MSFDTEGTMEKELERKFNIPLTPESDQIIRIVDAFVAHINPEGLERKQVERTFTYYDEPNFHLLKKGDTLRCVHLDDENRDRHEYKCGAVNTSERIEEKFGTYHDMEKWALSQGFSIIKVAQVSTIHDKWHFRIGELGVEISFDRFFREKERTSLMFQEIEVECKKGDEEDFAVFVDQFEKKAGREMELTCIGIQKYERVIREIYPELNIVETVRGLSS